MTSNDMMKIAHMATFFQILDEQGEAAAIAYVERVTGEKIEDEEKPAESETERAGLKLVHTS